MDLVVLLGDLAAEIGRGLSEGEAKEEQSRNGKNGPEIRHFSEKAELEEWLFSWIREGDCVLFKGSNSMGLGAAAADLLARLQQSGKKA